MIADALDLQDRWYLRLGACEPMPWSEARRVTAEIERETAACPNTLVGEAVSAVLGSAKVGRQQRAQLRLLRAAVYYRRTREVPQLDDPFGAKLLHRVKEGTLLAWSLGQDGTDNGGTGGWAGSSQDIVLEVKR